MKLGDTRSKELGASMVEFALVIALIALVAIPAARDIGELANSRFCSLAGSFEGDDTLVGALTGSGRGDCKPLGEAATAKAFRN